MYKNLLLIGILFNLHSFCHAQDQSDNVPYWVSVMDNDSSANYFKALDSFKSYWEGKELPMENDEYMDEERRDSKLKRNKEIRERKNEERKHEKSFSQQDHLYDEAFKRFLNWKEDMFFFVREDGSIPSMEERMKIVNSQR